MTSHSRHVVAYVGLVALAVITAASAFGPMGAAAAPLGTRPPAADDWTLVRPAPLPGDRFARVADINDVGTIVGDSYGASGYRPVIWPNPRAIPEAIPGLASRLDTGVINNFGTVCGHDAAGIFRYRPVAGIERPPATTADYTVGGINNSDDCTLFRPSGSVSRSEGYIWKPSGELIGLGLGEPRGINDRGEVVGAINMSAVMWGTGGIATTLPSSTGGAGLTSAMAINNSGDIIGWGPGDNRCVGLLLSSTTNWTWLFPLCQAQDINDAGMVPGESGGSPAVWAPDHGVIDLDPQGELDGVTKLTAINNRGDILGYYWPASGFETLIWLYEPATDVPATSTSSPPTPSTTTSSTIGDAAPQTIDPAVPAISIAAQPVFTG